MRVIAYTYEADVHCPACTKERFPADSFSDYLPDEHDVGTQAVDREYNPIHPVFDIDEHGFTHCGTCGEEL